jgi:carbon storage regulator
MLVLTRNVGEEIVIDGHIRVTVVSVRGDKVRVGVTAPGSMRVDRREVHERRQLEEMELEPMGITGLAVK